MHHGLEKKIYDDQYSSMYHVYNIVTFVKRVLQIEKKTDFIII